MYGYLRLRVNVLQWKLVFVIINDKKKVLKIGDHPCSKHQKTLKLTACELQLDKLDTDFSLRDTRTQVVHVFRASSAELCGMWLAHVKMLKQGIDPNQFLNMSRRIRFNPVISTLPFQVASGLRKTEEREREERARFEDIEQQVRHDTALELAECTYFTDRAEKRLKVTEMGFDVRDAADALMATSGNLTASVDILTRGDAAEIAAFSGYNDTAQRLLRLGYRAAEAENAVLCCSGDGEKAEQLLKQQRGTPTSTTPPPLLSSPPAAPEPDSSSGGGRSLHPTAAEHDGPISPVLKRVSILQEIGQAPLFLPADGVVGDPLEENNEPYLGDATGKSGATFLSLHSALQPGTVHASPQPRPSTPPLPTSPLRTALPADGGSDESDDGTKQWAEDEPILGEASRAADASTEEADASRLSEAHSAVANPADAEAAVASEETVPLALE
eukprot:Rhum_TRINITY_DN16664_c0_g1::Rhum_TRINITY_DN16664_c0_g1_i1::g.163801::m.163801